MEKGRHSRFTVLVIGASQGWRGLRGSCSACRHQILKCTLESPAQWGWRWGGEENTMPIPVLAPGQVNHILQVVGLGIEWEIVTVLFWCLGL